VVVVTSLTGCDSISSSRDGDGRPDVFDNVRSIDLSPRLPPKAQASRVGAERPSRFESYFGTTPQPAAAPVVASPGGDGYELNFDNTPVATVAKVILGDILGIGYTIDPRVQGTVSLASGQPVQRADLLYVLESALRLSNIALVSEGNWYRLVPAGEATGTGRVDVAGSRRPAPGFGITVLPLRFVSAQTALRLFDGFGTRAGMVRADPSRNILIIQGTAAERSSALETVMSFDVDWMRGQSVGIYPVRNAAPEPVIAELEKIMGAGEGGPAQSLIRFQAVARLNAILVVTSRPALLKTAASWVSRLDRSDMLRTGVRVYRVRYGDARQLAALLNNIFVGGSDSAIDTPANQIAPGSGATVSSSSAQPPVGTQPQLGTTQQPPIGVGGTRGTPPALGSTGFPPTRGATAPAAGTGNSQVILPGVRITADAANNSLLIYANQENYRIIQQTLLQLDRPQLQVAIDATIAEITLNDGLSYGVQYFLKSKDVGLKPDTGSVGLFGSATSATLSRALPGFNFLIGPEADPRLILDALRNITSVKVLSAPSLVVLDNQVAILQVGDQIPITTQSATAVTAPGAPIVSSVDYRNTGVILRVVPRINVNGNVLLDIEQEISNVANTSTANTLTPTVSQRRVKSSIAVANGQTVLLAGLISERQERTRSGIPVLEQLEFLGDLFAHNKTAHQRTELIIFIRPQIIGDGVDARRVAEELRSKLRGTLETRRSIVPLLTRPPPAAQ
jgi:general secretion pathway protein D